MKALKIKSPTEYGGLKKRLFWEKSKPEKSHRKKKRGAAKAPLF